MKTAVVLFLALLPSLALAQNDAIFIYNVGRSSDFNFAMIAGGGGHHAYEYDIPNKLTLERSVYDWIPIGYYVCLAGYSCILDGAGVHLVDTASHPIAGAPPIDFWGHLITADELPLDRLRYVAPYWLQALTARAVAYVTGGTAVAATVLLPNAWVLIDPQCAGLVRIVYCVLLALCVGYFVAAWRWRLLLIVLAFPVGFALNVARIAGLVM